jgi:hypothetical protein
MAAMNVFKVGDKVKFGRKFGEQTLGEVIKVNGRSVKVKTLAKRGALRSYPVGSVWNVAIGLVELVDSAEESARLESIPEVAADVAAMYRALDDAARERRRAAARKAVATRKLREMREMNARVACGC